MFRQKIYNENENNNLKDRLEYLHTHNITYDRIRFYDINSNGWISIDDVSLYKIQKEALSDNTLILYIYKESV